MQCSICGAGFTDEDIANNEVADRRVYVGKSQTIVTFDAGEVFLTRAGGIPVLPMEHRRERCVVFSHEEFIEDDEQDHPAHLEGDLESIEFFHFSCRQGLLKKMEWRNADFRLAPHIRAPQKCEVCGKRVLSSDGVLMVGRYEDDKLRQYSCLDHHPDIMAERARNPF